MQKDFNIVSLIVSTVASMAITSLIVSGLKKDTGSMKRYYYYDNGKQPRGYRNNNPLNIRINSDNQWEGKVLPNTDGAFEQFTSMAYGYRAALRLMRNKINSGYNTIQKLISVWAPAVENNTSGYVKRVCDYLNANPYDALNSYDKQQLSKMAYAMSLVENDNVLPNMTDIYHGWDLL